MGDIQIQNRKIGLYSTNKTVYSKYSKIRRKGKGPIMVKLAGST